ITTFDGQPFRLSEQRGKPVVINFWASWCGPCHDEAPALQRLWERYEGRVIFIGITHADEPDDSLAFIERYNVTYPNAEDPRDDVTKRLYRITGVPETFVIDQNGQVVKFLFSAVQEDEMIALLDGLLGEAT
ncbi:MAG: TlpA family protein disulfide reductase, partial [Anaerolineae bacterium]|nr:TlpA family protein disulfide reductase [Anaerolineae bacterium]